MSPRIHIHPVTDYAWSFRRETGPSFRPCIDGVWAGGSTVEVDPTPAYAHDAQVLTDAVTYTEGCFPLRWDVHLFSADREEWGRSNGHSNLLNGYRDSDYVRLGGLIFLSGKRIPPHPAMTRHLVAHELGHNVEWMLQDARGEKDFSDTLIREYAEMRGLPEASVHHGSPGTWHDSATEIFACDFRIVVCGVEREYWPHPGVPRPETAPNLHDWWGEARSLVTAITEVAA